MILADSSSPGAYKPAVSVLLTTMPKSGSIYVTKTLAQILDLKTMYIANPATGLINEEDALTFCAGGYVSQNHLVPSPENLQTLQQLKLKTVLHLRDPRQALLSWVHHLDWKYRTEGLILCQPAYYEFSLPSKIDWQIENYFPKLISWTQRWVEIADEGVIPILITHQDDLRCNEWEFFDRILAFNQIQLRFKLPNLPRTLDATHFRKADPEEWKLTFSSKQATRATRGIPESLQKRFCWDDERFRAAA